MEDPEFSVEDRGFILTYAHVNSLNPDEEEPADKWASLGAVLGCDVQKIRDAIRSWQNEDTLVLELEDAEEDHLYAERHARSPSEPDFLGFEAGSHRFSRIGDWNMIPEESADESGLDIAALPVATVSGVTNQRRPLVGSMRRVRDSDREEKRLVVELTGQTFQELEQRRVEHLLRVDILNQKLQQGKEIFDEQMKILRAKREELERKIHCIDYVVGHRGKLHKKFKSSHL